MKKNHKSTKGITLIALVITIVVLLILAGISIATLTGENGILSRAKDASNNTDAASAKEKVQLLLTDYGVEKYTNEGTNDLITYLNGKKDKGEIDEVTDNNDGTITVEVDGYEVVIKTDNLSILSTDKVGGVRPQISSAIYQTNGSTTVDGTTYDEVVITVKVTNKTDLTSVDSIVLKNAGGTEITKEGSLIGDSSADASYKVTQGGIYTVTVTGTKDGVQKSKTVQVTVTQISARAGLKVGDYIDYTPDTAGAYTTLTSSNTGSSSNSASITQDSLKWQILKINADGSMDLIGNPTSQNIYFQGATGYNNGVNIMNDICKSLYSKTSNGITARSVNLEDYEYWLTDTAKQTRTGYATYSGGPTYGKTQTYTSNRYYPNLYSQEIGSKINTDATAGVNQETGSTTGLSLSQEGTASGSTQSTNGLTVTQTYYYISNVNSTNFGDGATALYNSTYSWVASRYAGCGSSRADFGLRGAGSSLGGYGMFGSYGNTSINYFRLRPVVSLGSNVQITANTTASTDSNTPHTITQY